jgi:tetratricopeptide (TPR) repeat protein
MKKLIFIVAGLLVVATIFFLWYRREPSTTLVDDKGRVLTAGRVPGEEGTLDDKLFEEVRTLIDERAFAAAKESLLKIIETSDRDGEACILLCRVTRELKEVEQSLDYGLKAVELLPDSAEAHLWYAKAIGLELSMNVKSITGIFSAMKGIGLFKKEAQRVIELDPDDTEARMMLMFTNLAPKPIGNMDRAIRYAKEIETIDPMKGKHFLAICYHQNEETERAIELCKSGIAEFPQEGGFHVTLADIHVDRERFKEADAEYEAARRGEKDAMYYRSLYYQALMRVDHRFECARAVALLDEFIAGEPRFEGLPSIAYACLRKGNALELLERKQDARRAYEESLRHEPGFEPAREALDSLTE